MIVVAAVAVSLWLWPVDLLPYFSAGIGDLVRVGSLRKLVRAIQAMLNGHPEYHGFFSIQPMVVVWTLALLVLEWLHFRPPLHRVASQPGFAATCAVALAVVLVGSINYALLPDRPDPSTPLGIQLHAYLALSLTFSHGQCGAAVAAAWMMMALTGRWRPRPDWLDRTGRALGLFWLAVFPLTPIEAFLSS